jgi:serine/threonine protein phosphatase PrpC
MHVYSAMNTCCIVNALIRLALRVNCEGVYDGHGGRQVADFLEETLENTIYQELVVDDDASIPERLARYVPSFSASQSLLIFMVFFCTVLFSSQIWSL